MGNTPIVAIDATGAHKPTFAECLAYFKTSYASIYGQDVIDQPDDRDTQWLSLMAAALDDVNAETIAAYNSFLVAFAQGVGLSSLVKINGIKRKTPSFSMVDVLISGVVGTEIDSGLVKDDLGQVWALPATVIIPPAGQILVTATATVAGALTAAANSVTSIFTPVAGWQSVTNPAAATVGAPVEKDAQLKARQSFSASLPALGTSDGLISAIAATLGVVRYQFYANSDPGPDSYGIPGRSIAVVVDGGDANILASIIKLKKGEGVATFGTTEIALQPNSYGVVQSVRFSRPRSVQITYALRVVPLAGFTADIKLAIQKALADFTNATAIGGFVELADAFTAARLTGAQSKTFRIVPGSLLVARDGLAPSEQDISLAFDEAAYCVPPYVAVSTV